AMYGATSFFFTAAVRLCALCSASQFGELLFQLLRLLLQAIGHVDQSLNPCQHLKFFWRQAFSLDVRQREFLASDHDRAAWMATAKVNISTQRLQAELVAACGKAAPICPPRHFAHRPRLAARPCPGLLRSYSNRR